MSREEVEGILKEHYGSGGLRWGPFVVDPAGFLTHGDPVWWFELPGCPGFGRLGPIKTQRELELVLSTFSRAACRVPVTLLEEVPEYP